MNIPSLLLIILFSFSLSHFATAAERPKIGLVLSGGGAKGSAHIGVLKILEKNKVPIDYIAGTSIGAYVAGLYALGHDAKSIEKIMMGTNWNAGYSDNIPRESLHFEEKQQRDQFNLPIKLGYGDQKVKTTSGILVGQSVSQILRSSTDLVAEFESFDNLAIPFRAIAADLETSLPVVLSSGSIVDAMKASATVPGALQPMIINGKMLVDGGLANNMPVDVVKGMGADIIIAVDIGSSLAKKEDINSTVDVLNQLSTILTSATTAQQKLLLTEKDILIRPEVGELSTTDWSVLPQALALGETAALAMQSQFKQLSVSDDEYLNYTQTKQRASKEWLKPIENPIVKIVYENSSNVNKQIIQNSFEVHVGDTITQQELQAAIERVYALDKFEHVDAEFDDTNEGRVLILKTKEKSWGPNYFKFGFSLHDNFSLDTNLLIDFAYIMTNVTENGGSWKNEITLGYEKKIGTEFYQPIGKEHRFFSRSRLQWEHKNWGGSSQESINGELSKKYYRASTGLGLNIFEDSILEVGIIGENGNIAYNHHALIEPEYNSLGAYLHFGFDNLNSISFPTSGNQLLLDIYARRDNYDPLYFEAEQDNSMQYELNWRGALSLGNHTFVGIASFARVESEVNYTVHVSELGGFLNLSGFQKNELVGPQKVFGALVYHYDLGRDVFGLEEQPVYLGTSIETGNVWLLKESIDVDEMIYSGSLFLGTDTSFGPAALGIGYSESGESSVFLSIGKNW